MSWTADIGDAIIALDDALQNFQWKFGNDMNVQKSDEYRALRHAAQHLMVEACGDGTHFEDVAEALRFRNVTDHAFTHNDTDGRCGFTRDGGYTCNLTARQHTQGS